jgi:hypothetical protein
MWMRIIRGEREAIKEAIPYCRGDIPPLVDLYNVLRPYTPSRRLPNMNLWRGVGIECCPKCAGENLQSRGFSITLSGRYHRFQCLDCGGWCQGKAEKRVIIR